MRLLAFFLLAWLLLAPRLLVAQDDPPEEPVPEEETAPPEDAPKSRLRPMTEAEEEEYKRQVVREDPFLNAPPGPAAKDLAFYRPIDWLRFDVEFDSARYLIQDAAGAFRGFLTIDIAPDVSTAEDLIRLSLNYAAPRKRVEMLLEADSLKPRNVSIFAPASRPDPPPLSPKAAKTAAKAKAKQPAIEPPQEPSDGDQAAAPPEDTERRTQIEYLFDRVTIERDAGVVTTQERMRQLPYSFDIEQLPLLVRQLDFARLERQWPFEALVTDPEHKRSLPLQIEKPRRVDVLSAEPQTRAVFELQMRLGATDVWKWWVERVAPYRLVKFTDGRYTYTLNQYDPAPGEY